MGRNQTVTAPAVDKVVKDEAVTAPAVDGLTKYIKNITNDMDIKGFKIPDGSFVLPELTEKQAMAFKHALSTGVIKEVE